MSGINKRSFPARLFSGITALGTALCMLPAMPNLTAEADAAEYNLLVCNTRVTSDNKNDILGDGVFSYNPDLNLLTINGDVTYDGNIIYSYEEVLSIYAASPSRLTASSGMPLKLIGENNCTTISGAELRVYSPNYFGIYSTGTLRFENATVYAEAEYPISGNKESSSLEVVNSAVYAVCSGDYGAVTDFNRSLSYDRISIPEHYTIKNGCVYDADTNQKAKSVQFGDIRKYDITIAGTQVTMLNADDILGDGVISYDAATKTLDIHGICGYDENGYILVSSVPGLTINMKSNSTLITAQGSCIGLHADTTITGEGELRLITWSDCSCGVVMYDDADLTVESAKILVSSAHGFTTMFNSDSELKIRNSDISADCQYAVKNFSNIVLEGCFLKRPDNGYISNSDIYDENGNIAKVVDIKPDEYDLYVAGKPVTAQNAADILGNGVCSFDAGSNTLMLNGDYTSDSNTNFIENKIDGLTVYTASDSTISVRDDGIYSDSHDVTVTGPGKLTMNGAIYVQNSELTIKDANLNLRSDYGLIGGPSNDSLVVINSTIHAEGSVGAICDFENGITLQDCYLISPENAVINDTGICNSDGTLASVVDIVPAGTLAIKKQPEDVSGCIGDKVTFSVEATGTDLIYQWQYFNTATNKWENTGLAGNKTSTLMVSVLASRNGMRYHCIVKNGAGKKRISDAATLRVDPKITAQPADASGAIGEKVQFSVNATGVGLIYQWQYYNASAKRWENTGLAGNKTPTLTVTVIAGRNNMKYHCVVKDTNGTRVVSTAAALKVSPKIVTQPVDASGCIGDKVQFAVEATGVGLIYQWQYYNTAARKWENTGLAGNKTATLTVTVTAGRNNMKYHCIVKDANGTKLVSHAATLKVLPKIVTQPQNVTASIGETAKFTVEATGIGLTYQWQYYNTSTRKWEITDLAGNNTAELSVVALKNRSGTKYRCIVKDSAGNKLTSTAATLTVK